jgi:hypothetical protein
MLTKQSKSSVCEIKKQAKATKIKKNYSQMRKFLRFFLEALI